MNNNLSEPVSLSPPPAQTSFWSAHRRRPVFLLFLVVGLALVLIWLPNDSRTSLWMALGIQSKFNWLLILFALVTLSLIWSAGQRVDSGVFLFFNLHRYPRWLDHLMRLTTQLGNMLVAFIVALLFYLFNYHRLAIEIIFGTLTLWLLVETIKTLVDRDRPFLTLREARVIGPHERGDSFPSGHTTQIFFLATLLILRFHLKMEINVALYTIAVLVGFTRIYVGAHYPRDVLGGAILGSIWGILALMIDSYWLAGNF